MQSYYREEGWQVKIPKKLKICGKTFEVEMRNNRAVNDGAKTAAASTLWTQRIWIDSDQHREAQEEALLHETIEMISGEMDLGMEHSVTSTLSAVLYQVLKENNLLKE